MNCLEEIAQLFSTRIVNLNRCQSGNYLEIGIEAQAQRVQQHKQQLDIVCIDFRNQMP